MTLPGSFPLYAAAALAYRQAGWIDVLPLPPRAKTEPPAGFTGNRGRDPSEEEIQAWCRERPDGNVCLRVPPDVVGIDVDAYLKDGKQKQGAETLRRAEVAWGALPATWRSTSRPEDPLSGIRWFRVPPGVKLAGKIEMGQNGSATSDIETVQHTHRYAIVAPSIHPEGRPYVWIKPDGSLRRKEEALPHPQDLPDLPARWVEGLRALAGRDDVDARSMLESLPKGEPCAQMARELQKTIEACSGGSRHDSVRRRVVAILYAGLKGHRGALEVLEGAREAFKAAVANDRSGGADEARAEFNRLVEGGAGFVSRNPPDFTASSCGCDVDGPEDEDGMSDAHLADVVARDVLKGRWCWAQGLGWLHWDGRRWRESPEEALQESVRVYFLGRHRHLVDQVETSNVALARLQADGERIRADGGDINVLIARISDAKERSKALETLVTSWSKTLSKTRIGAVAYLCRGVVLEDARAFDKHPDLLNCPNGVLDLTTGILSPHDPTLLLTHMTRAEYRAEARHPDWDSALLAVPEDVLDWYQMRLGQAITGHMTPDDVLVLQVGSGENGKSTLTAAIQAALGDYFVLISHRALIANSDNHPTELMDFRGAHFALLEELPEERRLSVVRLKQLVGTPQITARHIRKDSMTFDATHSLFVSTNYKPQIEETDHGTWRRLACLRFPYRFLKPGVEPQRDFERRGDQGLRDRVKQGDGGRREAVLRWLVEGALRWYSAGRVMPSQPPRVVSDTEQWRMENDLILAYAGDRLLFEAGRFVISTEMLEDFNRWLVAHGQKAWGDKTFVARFGGHDEVTRRGVQKERQRSDDKGLSRPDWADLLADPPERVIAWFGVRFREPGDPDDPTPPAPTRAPEPTAGEPLETNADASRVRADASTRASVRAREVPGQAGQGPTVNTIFEIEPMPHGGEPSDPALPAEPRAGAHAHSRAGAHEAGTPEVDDEVPYVMVDEGLLPAVVEDLLGAPDLIAIDTETTGLDPLSDRVRLVQLSGAPGTFIIDAFQTDVRLLQPLFDRALLCGHNLKFDLQMLRSAGLRLPLDIGYRLMDSMIQSRLLEAGRRMTHSLAAVASRHLGLELDKSEQVSDWSGDLSEDQLRYAALDVRHLPELVHLLGTKVHEAGLTEVLLLEQRAIPAVAWLEMSGAPIDVERWESLATAAEQRRTEIEAELNRLIGPPPQSEIVLDGVAPRGINWASPKQVQTLLKERGVDLSDTAEVTLKLALERDPVIPLLLQHREVSKLATTYGREFLRCVHPRSGRIHPNWFQMGSEAGRMSCGRPNLQQIPRDAQYRSAIQAPEGRLLIKVDYSNIELRIAAEIARDARLVQAFKEGADVHRLTAQTVLGRTEVTKADRQAAKAVNFGLLYGMGARKLRVYARTQYGVELTEAEAQEYRRRFFQAYPGLERWHRTQAPDAGWVTAEGAQEERPIDTRTMSGRRRIGITRFTEKLNSPVQGTGADMLKEAMGRLFETRLTVPSARLILAVHDELVIECDAADSERATKWLMDCMRQAGQQFLKEVPVEVEAQIGRTWAGGE